MPNRLNWFYQHIPHAGFKYQVSERIREGFFIHVAFSPFVRAHAASDMQWIAEAPRRAKQARDDIRLLVSILRERQLTESEERTVGIIEARQVEPKIEPPLHVADAGDQVKFGYNEPPGLFTVREVDEDGLLFLEELKRWEHPELLVRIEGK
jgi:hypothetical protein